MTSSPRSGGRYSPRDLAALWRASLSTPVLYLVASIILNRFFFEAGEPEGFLAPEETLAKAAPYLAVGLAVVLAAMVEALTRRRREMDWVRYYRQTFLLLVLSDSVALLGFVLYALVGALNIQFALCLVSWALYTRSRPDPGRFNHDDDRKEY